MLADRDPDAGAADDVARFRALFLCDVLLGRPACQADALLRLLRGVECDHLYLVGNFLDGQQLRRRFFWHQLHNDVVQKLLRRARKGTRTTYVTGGHDAVVADYAGLSFGDILIERDAVHETADGSRLLVTSGNDFDPSARLQRLGSLIARWRPPRPSRRWAAFEVAALAEARRRGLDGVVCGHSGQPAARRVDGLWYCNGGDWVHSLTAVAERSDGTLTVLRAPAAVLA